MKTILITGASGFLGSNFIKHNSSSFHNIIGLTRSLEKTEDNIKLIRTNIADGQESKRIFEIHNPDIVLHFAFDHSYKDNVKIIKSLVNAASKSGFKGTFLLISSISVLKILKGRLTSQFNSYYDPYCMTKRSVERYFRKSKVTFKKQIIYPTIVYGPGGNWNRFFEKCINADYFSLPKKGDVRCNYIHVDEFSKKLFNNIGKEPEIILGGKNGRWIDLYKEFGETEYLNVTETKNLYHDNLILNIILFIWHKTPLGIGFNYILQVFYRLKGGHSFSKEKKNEVILKHASPTFSNRFIHSSNFEL